VTNLYGRHDETKDRLSISLEVYAWYQEVRRNAEKDIHAMCGDVILHQRLEQVLQDGQKESRESIDRLDNKITETTKVSPRSVACTLPKRTQLLVSKQKLFVFLQELDEKITESIKVSPRSVACTLPQRKPLLVSKQELFVFLQEVRMLRNKVDATATFFGVAAFVITLAVNAIKIKEALGL
jgi:ubiquinone biosynthesis protein UbiJ